MSRLHVASSTDAASRPAVEALDRDLAAFYNRPEIAAYFTFSEDINHDWKPSRNHMRLHDLCGPGMRVLDLGCGSAHACRNLKDTGCVYTGVDWSRAQVERNIAANGPADRFLSSSLYNVPLPDGSFDVVFSLYTLEHLAFPARFLDEAFRLTRPGGRIVIICPEFRRFGLIPSLDFGPTTSRLKEKLKCGLWLESLEHAWLSRIYYPCLLASRYGRETHPFLVNLLPTCLRGTYYQDNDAVYFVDSREIREHLSALGAEDETEMRTRDLDVHKATCFVVVRRTVSVADKKR